MGYPTKIATCCYCGSRAALVLGKGRHELACSSCGAPLHDMKRFRREPEERRGSKARPPHPYKRNPKRSDDYYEKRSDDYQRKRRKPVKKRKGLMRHLFEEAFDVIEDIFD